MSTYNEDRLQFKIDELLRERGVMESLVHDLNHKLKTSEAKFEAHTEAVGRFVAELYAIMIDPLESAEQNVKDTCVALIEQAKQDRESLRELHEIKAGRDATFERLSAEAKTLYESIMDVANENDV